MASKIAGKFANAGKVVWEHKKKSVFFAGVAAFAGNWARKKYR